MSLVRFTATYVQGAVAPGDVDGAAALSAGGGLAAAAVVSGSGAAALSAAGTVTAAAKVPRVEWADTFESWASGSISTAQSPWSGRNGFPSIIAASPFDGGQALETGPGGEQLNFNVTGLAQWRLRFYMQQSGTASTNHYYVLISDGSGGQADLRMDLATSQIWLRINAAAGTHSKSTFTAGSPVRVELEWTVGVGGTADLFHGSNLHGATPDESLVVDTSDSGTAATLTPTIFYLGNNATDGVTTVYDGVVFTTDGLVAGPWALGAALLTASGSLSVAGDVTSGAVEHFGEAAFSAAASLAAAGSVTQVAGAALGSVGALVSSASVTQVAAAALGAAGTLSAAGLRAAHGASLRAGESSLSAAGSVTQVAAAALGVAGVLSAVGLREVLGASLRAGESSLSVSASVTQTASSSLAAASVLSASGAQVTAGSAGLDAVGGLSGQASVVVSAQAALAAAGGLAAAGDRIAGTVSGFATLNGAGGGLAAVARVNVQGATLRAGQSSLSAVGTRGVLAVAELAAAASLDVEGRVGVLAAGALAGQSSMSAVGVRVVVGLASFAAQSAMPSVQAAVVTLASFYTWDGSQYLPMSSVRVKGETGWYSIGGLHQKTASGWRQIHP